MSFLPVKLFVSLMLPIIVWNVQGAAGHVFKSVAKPFINVHKPKIFVMVEPRISGVKAEKVTKGLKFEHSHRI